jgi:plastocyanin
MKSILAIGCLALVAGCGDDTNTVTPTSVTPSSPPSSSTAVTVGANGGTSFTPATVSINTGGTVTWTWPAGSLPHTVTSGHPGAPDGMFCSLPAGQTASAQSCAGSAYAQTGPATFSHTFTSPGTFPYFCQVHGAMMTGTVTVTAAASTTGGTTTGGTTTGGTTTGGTTGGTTTGGTTGHY